MVLLVITVAFFVFWLLLSMAAVTVTRTVAMADGERDGGVTKAFVMARALYVRCHQHNCHQKIGEHMAASCVASAHLYRPRLSGNKVRRSGGGSDDSYDRLVRLTTHDQDDAL